MAGVQGAAAQPALADGPAEAPAGIQQAGQPQGAPAAAGLGLTAAQFQQLVAITSQAVVAALNAPRGAQVQRQDPGPAPREGGAAPGGPEPGAPAPAEPQIGLGAGLQQELAQMLAGEGAHGAERELARQQERLIVHQPSNPIQRSEMAPYMPDLFPLDANRAYCDITENLQPAQTYEARYLGANLSYIYDLAQTLTQAAEAARVGETLHPDLLQQAADYAQQLYNLSARRWDLLRLWAREPRNLAAHAVREAMVEGAHTQVTIYSQEVRQAEAERVRLFAAAKLKASLKTEAERSARPSDNRSRGGRGSGGPTGGGGRSASNTNVDNKNKSVRFHEPGASGSGARPAAGDA